MTTNPDTHRTALVTGASRGLGLALARQLARDGWRVIIDGRDREALHAAAREIRGPAGVDAVAGDVADPGHRAALRATADRAGGLDALVHNASLLGGDVTGPPALGPLARYPLEDLRRVLEVNTVAPLALTQVLLPSLRPGSRILAVTSDAAIEAHEGWGGYGASKAALEQMFAVLATERPDLRIHRVDPGDMRTRMHQDAEPGEDITHLPLPEASVPGLLTLLTGDISSGRHEARDVPTVSAEREATT